MPARHTFLQRVDLDVPTGADGFWSVIRQIDKLGPWTVGDVVGRTRSNKGSVSAYCKRLRLGGFIEPAGERDNPCLKFKEPSVTYRVLRPVATTPRLRADGTELPEPLIETIWRALKMNKDFTAREIHVDLMHQERRPSLNSIRTYLHALLKAGIIRRTDGGKNAGRSGGGTTEAQFHLVRNVGPQAPKVLTGRIVFDPNARRVVAATVIGEVSP